MKPKIYQLHQHQWYEMCCSGQTDEDLRQKKLSVTGISVIQNKLFGPNT